MRKWEQQRVFVFNSIAVWLSTLHIQVESLTVFLLKVIFDQMHIKRKNVFFDHTTLHVICRDQDMISSQWWNTLQLSVFTNCLSLFVDTLNI